MTIACPLCTSLKISAYHQDNKRTYLQCSECQLIFVPPSFHLTPAEEKRIYDLHENSPDDEGYRHFLDKLLAPLCAKLPSGAQGLDFGCGPGPAIKPIMAERGFNMDNYDIYYQHQPQYLAQRYHFITCTEAIEHFSQPRQELKQLDSMLKPNGILGIMTKRVIAPDAFKRWHYKNDPTHICFFSEETFRWIADWLNYRLEFPGNDTVILTKLY